MDLGLIQRCAPYTRPMFGYASVMWWAKNQVIALQSMPGFLIPHPDCYQASFRCQIPPSLLTTILTYVLLRQTQFYLLYPVYISPVCLSPSHLWEKIIDKLLVVLAIVSPFIASGDWCSSSSFLPSFAQFC